MSNQKETEIELKENPTIEQKNEDPYQKVSITENEDDRLKKLKEQAENLRGNADAELRKNLLFDLKDISIWRLMCHLSESLDILCMILATIGSLAGGISMPIIAYLSGDMFSTIGDTDPNAYSSALEATITIKNELEDAMMTQVRRFLYIGTGMFFAHFMMVSFWTYCGLRQVHALKEVFHCYIKTGAKMV